MKSRWKQLMPMDEAREYVALASLIPPKGRSSTWRLFRGSRAVATQLCATEGVLGFSMLARPLLKEYATLSLWVDDAALDSFARSTPHDQLRQQLADQMAATTFVRWAVAGSDGVPSWSDALDRLRRSTAPEDGTPQ